MVATQQSSSKKDSRKKRLGLISKDVKHILQVLGYDTNHMELKKTPMRYAKLLLDEVATKDDVKKLFQVSKYPFKSMITLRDHTSFSWCPHHLQPVEVKVWVSYIPNGKILGLSKLARIANYFCKGLFMQEEITDGIADGLMNALDPLGVAVSTQGRHMCMQARGVKTHGDVFMSSLKGVYLKDQSTKDEYYQIIGMERR